MRIPALAVLAALSLSACGGHMPMHMAMMEQGYEPGALGVSAIARSDWRVAEANLDSLRGVKADDPARLINLGTVYMETGRTGEALLAWQHALAARHHYMVETVDGRTISTEQLAKEALARYATAAR
jgi:hypothetical protein